MNRWMLFVLLPFLAGWAFAADHNLIENPDFDDASQLSGWNCDSTWGTASWSTQDVLNQPESGSMEHNLGLSGTNNVTVTCSQCVPVSDLLSYAMSGWAYWPDDPDVGQIGTTRFGIIFYASPDCTDPTGVSEVVVGHPSTLDTWFEVVSDPVTAPLGASSANLLVATWQNFGDTPVRARVDHLAFGADGVFHDGFEQGDLSRWSSSQP